MVTPYVWSAAWASSSSPNILSTPDAVFVSFLSDPAQNRSQYSYCMIYLFYFFSIFFFFLHFQPTLASLQLHPNTVSITARSSPLSTALSPCRTPPISTCSTMTSPSPSNTSPPCKPMCFTCRSTLTVPSSASNSLTSLTLKLYVVVVVCLFVASHPSLIRHLRVINSQTPLRSLSLGSIIPIALVLLMLTCSSFFLLLFFFFFFFVLLLPPHCLFPLYLQIRQRLVVPGLFPLTSLCRTLLASRPSRVWLYRWSVRSHSTTTIDRAISRLITGVVSSQMHMTPMTRLNQELQSKPGSHLTTVHVKIDILSVRAFDLTNFQRR